MKEQLPGGSFFQPTDEIREHTQSVIPHNKVPERVFGILDFFLRYRPNATTISNEAFLMFAFNKTSEWLQSLPITEKRKIKRSRKEYYKSKHTNAILYYRLWQRPDDVENILAELTNTEKRMTLSSQIRFRQKVLKQLYKMSEKSKAYSLEKLEKKRHSKGIHTYNKGKWPWQVLSEVSGFPEFYHIVYDCDLQENSSPNAIYTYTLKEDYRNGSLKIVPEV
ncbi:hypothetical protein ACJMK2_025264 [Sinanodonta woodiana]|uniref:Transposase n=1 Tax=Sinanodonta woodiana TaxID=1069815 RepID=A0ABD3XFZ6_SINWO